LVEKGRKYQELKHDLDMKLETVAVAVCLFRKPSGNFVDFSRVRRTKLILQDGLGWYFMKLTLMMSLND